MTKRKSTTKPIQQVGESRRDKAKYPGLDRSLNLPIRQDYLEVENVNGIIDADGKQVVRAWTEAEKKFYSDFNEEVVSANFRHDKTLRKIYKEMKELKTTQKPTPKDMVRLMELELEYQAREDECLHYPDEEQQQALFTENNTRNRCMFNQLKTGKQLDSLDTVDLDKRQEQLYYDGEELLINQIFGDEDDDETDL